MYFLLIRCFFLSFTSGLLINVVAKPLMGFAFVQAQNTFCRFFIPFYTANAFISEEFNISIPEGMDKILSAPAQHELLLACVNNSKPLNSLSVQLPHEKFPFMMIVAPLVTLVVACLLLFLLLFDWASKPKK